MAVTYSSQTKYELDNYATHALSDYDDPFTLAANRLTSTLSKMALPITNLVSTWKDKQRAQTQTEQDAYNAGDAIAAQMAASGSQSTAVMVIGIAAVLGIGVFIYLKKKKTS